MKPTVLFCLLFITFGTVFAQSDPSDPEFENQWGFLNSTPYSTDYYDYHLGVIYATNEETVYLTTNQGSFYKSLDGGETWSMTSSEGENNFVDMKFADNENGFAVGTNGAITKTENAGNIWETVPSETIEDLTAIAIPDINNIWVIGENGVILHSIDKGNTWESVNPEIEERLNSIAFKDYDTGYITGNNGTFLKTTNGGETWNTVSMDSNDDFFSISITEEAIYMLSGNVEGGEDYSSRGTALLKSYNGTDWDSTDLQNTLLDMGAEPSSLTFKDAETGYIIIGAAALCDCCTVAIFKTEDGGQTWNYDFFAESSADPCLSNFGFANFSLVGSTGYAFQGNHALKLNGGDENWLDIKKYEKESISIYPNPTDDFITLQSKNTDLSHKSLKIFDIRGKAVYSSRHLPDQNRINVSGFESGVYFLRLFSHGNPIVAKKIIKR